MVTAFTADLVFDQQLSPSPGIINITHAVTAYTTAKSGPFHTHLLIVLDRSVMTPVTRVT